MTALNRSTRRRLQQLRQLPSIWEGDRRPLSPNVAMGLEPEDEARGECILWVDGTEGLVRAMDVVPPETGHEAIVRTLIRAMEYPHSSARPSRPQKIVVRDREIQFFLRGVLQDLEITIDYVQELPLIDEIFRGLQEVASNRPPRLPPAQAEALLNITYEIWRDAPWEILNEEKILLVESNYGEVGTLHVSILGMLGMEYGLLMYRSLDSLKQFRQRVLMASDSPESLEGAFLEQDCFFVTFDQMEDSSAGHDEDELLSDQFAEMGVEPSFGNLHPLEGMRPVLYEEEAIAVLVALQALHRFFQQHLKRIGSEAFPEISSRYRIADPQDGEKKVSVKVSTLPELALELSELSDEADLEDEFILDDPPAVRDDLIPKDVFYSLGAMSGETLELLRANVKFHQFEAVPFPNRALNSFNSTDEFPVILIQTSRPKALVIIEELQVAGGLQAICFNPGEDSFTGEHYDLGLLQTKNGDLHLFGEFIEDDPIHVQARQKWEQRCRETKGHCGLVIARGLKGATKGNPDFKDMLALFEVRSLSAQELGLGPLELVPQSE